MPGPPTGEIVAQLLLPTNQGYTLVDTGAGYVFHFHHTGNFYIGYDLAALQWWNKQFKQVYGNDYAHTHPPAV